MSYRGIVPLTLVGWQSAGARGVAQVMLHAGHTSPTARHRRPRSKLRGKSWRPSDVGLARILMLQPSLGAGRTHSRARSIGPRARAVAADGPAGALFDHLPFHQPRPVGGAADLAPRCGDVSRASGGNRRGGDALQRTDPSVYGGVAVGFTGSRRLAHQRVFPPTGRTAQPRSPAQRLPLPHALPVRCGTVRSAGAGTIIRRRWSARRLPLPTTELRRTRPCLRCR